MPKKIEVTGQKEVRTLAAHNIELRAGDDGQVKYIMGRGVVYNEKTKLWDGYSETIQRGAFDAYLSSNPELKSFFNHDPSQVLGTTSSDPVTLEINNRDDGIYFKVRLPDTSYGKDLAELVRNGIVKGASFSFIVNKSGSIWTEDEGGYHRTITSAQIFEIGPVTDPAYPQASVTSSRSKDELIAEARACLETVSIGEAFGEDISVGSGGDGYESGETFIARRVREARAKKINENQLNLNNLKLKILQRS